MARASKRRMALARGGLVRTCWVAGEAVCWVSLTGDVLRRGLVPFYRGRGRDVDIMILQDSLCVEFQSNDLLDLSLNTGLALGITENEFHAGCAWIAS